MKATLYLLLLLAAVGCYTTRSAAHAPIHSWAVGSCEGGNCQGVVDSTSALFFTTESGAHWQVALMGSDDLQYAGAVTSCGQTWFIALRKGQHVTTADAEAIYGRARREGCAYHGNGR